MEVPTLKHFSVLTIIECIINEECPCLTMEMQCLKLIKVLDQGSWGEESKGLLDRLVKFYRHKVTPIILEALLPLNAKELHLKECPLVTEKCLNTVVNRCQHLKLLDLTENPHFEFDKIQLFSFNKTAISHELTTVVLEDCPQVDDINIQALLKNAPLLMSLNIAHCNISDNVFLLNDVEQLKREICFKITPIVDNYDCKLRTVDVSRCKYFSSTGVRHLCTLCGPTLQSVNLSWTKVDCTSLLYLSGYGLPAAVQLFASFGFLGQPATCRLVSTLQDFEQISQELTKKWTSQLQECFGHLWNRKNAGMREVKMDQMIVTKDEENLKCANAGIVSKDKDINSVPDVGLPPSVSQRHCCEEDFAAKCVSAIPSHVGTSSNCDVTDHTDRESAVATHSPSTDTGVATHSPSTDTGVATHSPSTDTGVATHSPSTDTGVATHSPSTDTGVATHSPSTDTGVATHSPSTDTGVATHSPSTDTGVATHSPSTDTILVKGEKEACIHQDVSRLSLKEPPLTCLHEIGSNDQCELTKPTEKQSSIECNVQHNNNSCENVVVQCSCDSSLENSNISTRFLQQVCCAVTENSATRKLFSCALTLTSAADELKTARETTMSTEAVSERSVFLHKVTGDQPTGENDTKSQTKDKAKNEASTMSSDSEMNRETSADHSYDLDALEHAATFFTSNITNLSLNGSIFEVEKVGLQCFEQFLTANGNVATLRLYGGSTDNFVTDSVLKLIGEHAQNLTCLSVEGCDRITNLGIERLAECKQLQKIDFTGLHKIDDSPIIELVRNLNLSHLQLAETRVTSASLNAIALRNVPDLLKELDISWCDEMEDSEGLDNVVQTCTSLDRLMLRECCHFSTPLDLLAANCHNITELSVASNMAVISDESVFLLSKGLPLLEKIDLGWNTNLTNQSIQALLTNCRRLTTAILEGLKITSAPFLQIITVPDELKKFLTEAVNKKILAHQVGLNDFIIKLSELPCLPHRSMMYCTELQNLSLNYCDFVEDGELQEIVTVAHGSLKIIDYYGEEVEESVSSLESFIQVQITLILEEIQGLHS